MREGEKMEISKLMFETMRFAVCKAPLSEDFKKEITPEVLPSLYTLSSRHDCAHLVAEALESNGFLSEGTEAWEKYCDKRSMAVYRYERMHYEYESICALLEEEKIEYMPLKGSVIRALYPQPWMRTSCDMDILIRFEDLERVVELVKTRLDYRVGEKSAHDVSMYAENGVHLELHHTLNSDSVKRQEVFDRVWETATPTRENSYCKVMTDELFYFYHISHMAKHVLCGGCGVRPFLDLWILNHVSCGDKKAREALLKKGELFAFAKAAERLSEVWFSGAEADEISLRLQDYVLKGGVYGTMTNRVALQQQRKGGKFKYFMGRIFLPYRQLKYVYPVLEKYPFLYPFCIVARCFRLLKKDKAKKSLAELNAGANASEETKKEMQALLTSLELL